MASRSRRRWRDVNKCDLTLEAAISLFLMNQESRNYSPKTVRWYSDLIGRFAELLAARCRGHTQCRWPVILSR